VDRSIPVNRWPDGKARHARSQQREHETGELGRQTKSQLGKQKNQEFMKMFFRRARGLRLVDA
jgi:hypothetical protein